MTIFDVPVPTELGHPGGLAHQWHHAQGEGYVAAGYESTAELEFPASTAVYDKMRKTEGQIGAVLRAINLPILANRHYLQADGVSLRVKTFVETELGMNEDPTKGRARRRRQGILLREHLREALLSLPCGFAAFEQVYEPGEPTPEQAKAGVEGTVYHLRKLGPRQPRTIQEIRVHRDGGLAGILQAGIGWDTSGQGSGVQIIGGTGIGDDATEVFIPADRLVFYSYDKEGADWAGNSLLRTAYKNWLLKDQLLRIDAQAAERNGMGIPMVYFTDDGDRTEALAIAAGLRAGAYSGGAIPDGKYRVEIIGVQGSTKDLMGSIEYHDQAMGRSALAMFLNLGHDGGLNSGAVGNMLVDYFVMSLRAVDEWLCDIVTEHVIRDLVEVNFGPDEPYPVLACDAISAEGTPTAEALKTLVDAKIIIPDDDLEDEARRRYRLPAAKRDPLAGAAVRVTPAGEEPPAQDAPDLDPNAEGNQDAPPADPLLEQVTQLSQRITKLREGRHVR